MPKLHYGSRGGVYYKRKGRKVYVNKFGNSHSSYNENITEYQQLFSRLIEPVISKIVERILPDEWQNIKKDWKGFKCPSQNYNEDYCLRLIISRRILLKIIIDKEKYKFFKDAYKYGIDNNFNVETTLLAELFLTNFDRLIEEEKNVLGPVLLDNYMREEGNPYWSYLPKQVGEDYMEYANLLGNSLNGVLQNFIENDCKPNDTILEFVQSLLDAHPNASVNCDWRKQHDYNKESDGEMCPLCLEDFEENDKVITLLCDPNNVPETIHKKCLGENTWPTCFNRSKIKDCF